VNGKEDDREDDGPKDSGVIGDKQPDERDRHNRQKDVEARTLNRHLCPVPGRSLSLPAIQENLAQDSFGT
jgi:hypothetical protein